MIWRCENVNFYSSNVCPKIGVKLEWNSVKNHIRVFALNFLLFPISVSMITGMLDHECKTDQAIFQIGWPSYHLTWGGEQPLSTCKHLDLSSTWNSWRGKNDLGMCFNITNEKEFLYWKWLYFGKIDSPQNGLVQGNCTLSIQ